MSKKRQALKILNPDREMSVSTDLVNKNKNTNKNTGAVTTPQVVIHTLLTEDLDIEYKLKMLDAMGSDPFRIPFKIEPIELIVEAEEEELVQLKDPRSPSSIKLTNTFKEVAEAVSANIVLVIGHSELCTRYLEDEYNIMAKSSYPTLVFAIGCHSADEIYHLNQNEIIKMSKNYFIGFEDLVHCIDGEIYECEHPHLSIPNMDCRFPGSEQYTKALYSRSYNSNNNNNRNSRNALWDIGKIYNKNTTNPVLQCINAKFARFVNTYKEDINRRNCSKLTAESLIRKINGMKEANGEFKSHDNLTKEHFTIRRSDLVPCSGDTRCTFALNTEANRIAEEYDNKMKTVEIYYEIVKLFDKIFDEDEDEHRKNDERIVSYLNSLTRDQANLVLNKEVDLDQFNSFPVYFFLFIYKYTISSREIFSKYDIDWTKRSSDGYGLISCLVQQLKIEDKEKPINIVTGQKYENEFTYYTVKELFRLFLKIYEKTSEPFKLGNIPPNFSTFLLLLRDQFTEKLPLVKFYLRYFPGTTSSGRNVINYNEQTISGRTRTTTLETILTRIYPQNNEFKFLLEALFVYGVNPNTPIYISLLNSRSLERMTPLQAYEDYAEGYLDAEIIKLFFIYGARNSAENVQGSIINNNSVRTYLDERIKYFELVLRSPKLLNGIKDQYERMRKYMEGVLPAGGPLARRRYKLYEFRKNNYEEFVIQAIETYSEVSNFLLTADLASLRKRPEDIQRQLDMDLAPYIYAARAIPQLKEFYGTVQKYLKKQKIDPLLKQEFFEEAAELYKSKKPLENEGNSAVRRLELLQNKFDRMKNVVRNYAPQPTKQGGRRYTRRSKKLKRRKTRYRRKSTV